MLYKEFEKELKQVCKNICNKYIGDELDDRTSPYSEKWDTIVDEIYEEINSFIQTKLNHCKFTWDRCNARSVQYFLSMKFELPWDLHLLCLSIRAKTDPSNKIIRLVSTVKCVPVFNDEIDEIFYMPHPYLKGFLNKKISMEDDINKLTENIHKEIEKEYEHSFFKFMDDVTRAALDMYSKYILKNDCFSMEFYNSLDIYNHRFLSDLFIIVNNENRVTFREELKNLFLNKRIYSVKFEIFENGKKTEEKFFEALPMSQIKYYCKFIREMRHADVHTDSSGEALIRMTITNVFTKKVKTLVHCFNY